MPVDLRQEGMRNLETVQTTNRGLLERALRMRAVSYLAQRKVLLLTQTIFEIDRSKEELRSHSRSLEESRTTIDKQKAELQARTATLEEIQRTLEQRVQKRTQELERAIAALREEAAIRERIQSEREQLNEKYLRAQRLELVGMLTSGVAHDFNNLLTVIMGHGELARAGLAQSPVAESLDAILDATRRGAALTKQLLAFARKQPRSATVIDPACVINEFGQLLRRVLGESITLELRIEPRVGNVRIGASELEQIILNLIVNARDAMPKGGTVAISLGRVVRPGIGPAPHGPCVAITVKDTGEGMSEEVMQHAFEAFFTTKPAGVGTGLGLTTVDAIVRASDGQIEVQSRTDQGTTFRVYFPLVAETREISSINKDFSVLPRGTEVVLIVDDDESVRGILRQMLQSLGYQVFSVARAASALDLLARQRVDLMLVDSRLAGMSSENLVSEVAVRWPRIHILFMSGHADRPRDGDGHPFPQVEKPLQLVPFASTLRKILDQALRS